MPGGGSKPGERRGGRQKGTPNKTTAEVRAYAGQYTEEAIRDLVRIAKGRKTPPATKVAAWREVLDRAVGKAPQAVTGEDGMPLLPTVIKHVVERQ
jgi:hypothetical protein